MKKVEQVKAVRCNMCVKNEGVQAVELSSGAKGILCMECVAALASLPVVPVRNGRALEIGKRYEVKTHMAERDEVKRVVIRSIEQRNEVSANVQYVGYDCYELNGRACDFWGYMRVYDVAQKFGVQSIVAV